MNRKYWRRRHCEGCKKKFWVRLCYLRRKWNSGRFCSIPCRSKKPRLSELSKKIGKKAARSYRQKELFQRTRLAALTLLCKGQVPKCVVCGCDVVLILEVNHKLGGGRKRKECGVMLWRMVLRLGKKALKFFNVKCKVCNQLDYVERCFGLHKHSVVWNGEKR